MTNMSPATSQTMVQQDPGRTLGIVGLILAFVASLVGMIISIVALNQSKKAGYDNGLAKAGIIVGAILTVFGLVGSIVYFAVVIPAMQAQLGR